jgi:hypothetical protein
MEKGFLRTTKASGVRITPKMLRSWFSTQLADLGVPDRYVDALTGHTPKSILARHYTDFNPAKLREIYEKAGIRVLESSKLVSSPEVARIPEMPVYSGFSQSDYEQDALGHWHERERPNPY